MTFWQRLRRWLGEPPNQQQPSAPVQRHTNAAGVQVDYAGHDVTIVNIHITPDHTSATPPVVAPSVPRQRATPEQAEVLALMKGLPDRIAVLDFMEREFQTRMVIDLEGHALFRLRRYVETTLQNNQLR